MPEKALKKLNAYLLPQWKVCFFAALLVGTFAHLYKITNWLPNWDSLVFRYDPQNMIALGRWFLPVACAFSSFYDLPFLNGIIAIVLHGISAVYICRILGVQKKVTAFMVGAVVVSFPTVTSVLMYNYVADGYSIAFLLATLAAWYMTKEKPRYILGAVLVMLSTAIYQAYVTVTIMLLLFVLIDGLAFRNVPVVTVLKKAAAMLAAGVAGMVAYAVVLKILLSVLSMELLEYQGISGTAGLSNLNLYASLYVIKETFLKCFFDFSKGVNVYVVLNCVVVVFTVACYIVHIVRSKLYKDVARLILILVLTAALVPGAGALAIINASIDYHNLMLMGYCVFYLFFLFLYERGVEKEAKHTCVKCWLILLTAAAIIGNQVVISNVSYHKAQIAFEKSYGVLVRIGDRIEQTPGGTDCEKILVIGALDDSQHYSVNLSPNITGITDGYIVRADDETVGQSVLCSALEDYCGLHYEFVSGEAKKALCEKDEIKALSQWPAADCMTIVDDTLVIKLGIEGEG